MKLKINMTDFQNKVVKLISTDVKEAKKAIRKEIAAVKKNFTLQWRVEQSAPILEKIEALDAFANSNTILLYHALPDEVQTAALLNKWCERKRLVLPVVDGEDLILRRYLPDKVEIGYCKILEPTDTEIIQPDEIELAIVPGVAFDRAANRLGRGRGFYDRLLPALRCDIVGLGFEFQIVEEIPMEPFDQPLTKVVTENCCYPSK